MTRLLHLLRHGKGLRHLPVVQPDRRDDPVRVILRGMRGGALDVTSDHVPVSLRPLVLGIRVELAGDADIADAATPCLELRDARDHDRLLARIDLKPAGALPLSRGELRLFETLRCRNWCAPLVTRWARYALAWQHARRAPARNDGLCMTASDLRCLNAYYIVSRPVYLVSVAHADQVNVFPMDLVGDLASGEFLLALRATSPAVGLIERSKRIAMSGAPRAQLKSVYALGAHHRSSTIDPAALPFAMRASDLFGLPVLAEPGLVRELSVLEAHRVGSHVLFVTRVERDSGRTIEQLAHVSGMYAEWLRGRGRSLTAGTPV